MHTVELAREMFRLASSHKSIDSKENIMTYDDLPEESKDYWIRIAHGTNKFMGLSSTGPKDQPNKRILRGRTKPQ